MPHRQVPGCPTLVRIAGPTSKPGDIARLRPESVDRGIPAFPSNRDKLLSLGDSARVSAAQAAPFPPAQPNIRHRQKKSSRFIKPRACLPSSWPQRSSNICRPKEDVPKQLWQIGSLGVRPISSASKLRHAGSRGLQGLFQLGRMAGCNGDCMPVVRSGTPVSPAAKPVQKRFSRHGNKRIASKAFVIRVLSVRIN